MVRKRPRRESERKAPTIGRVLVAADQIRRTFAPRATLIANSRKDVDKGSQKDGVVALELEKIAGSSGASESEITVDLS
ncbi:hypothetical protein Tco_1244354 [Tanacetum coccineum]